MTIMKSNKEYRFDDNPKEKEFHDKFLEEFGNDTTTLSAIIFGWHSLASSRPKDYLTDREASVCLNMIQWLGSPVGQRFLKSCGFRSTDNCEHRFATLVNNAGGAMRCSDCDEIF